MNIIKKRRVRKRILNEVGFDIKGFKLALVFVNGTKIKLKDSNLEQELYKYGFTIEDVTEHFYEIPQEFDKADLKGIQTYCDGDVCLIKLENRGKIKNLEIFYVFLKSKHKKRTTEFDSADYMPQPIMGFHICTLNDKVICESDIYNNRFTDTELSYDFIDKVTFGNSHIVYEYDNHSVISIHCKYEKRSTLDIFVFEKK